MEHGAFNMIQKANNKVCDGNSWHPHDPRKCTCWNHKWRQCSSLSLILFPLNSFHKARQNQAYCVEMLK